MNLINCHGWGFPWNLTLYTDAQFLEENLVEKAGPQDEDCKIKRQLLEAGETRW